MVEEVNCDVEVSGIKFLLLLFLFECRIYFEEMI